MKVVCVDVYEGGRPNKDLTLGKTYLVISTHQDPKKKAIQLIAIKNDKGNSTYYYKTMFRTIDEIREEKLNQLGV
jgi:hypothetical protein